MAFHQTVYPEVQRSGIAVTVGQRSSETKSLGDDKGEEKIEQIFQKEFLRRTLRWNCTAVICKTILGLSFQFSLSSRTWCQHFFRKNPCLSPQMEWVLSSGTSPWKGAWLQLGQKRWIQSILGYKVKNSRNNEDVSKGYIWQLEVAPTGQMCDNLKSK